MRDKRNTHAFTLSSVVCKWIYVLYCVTYISHPPTRFERCVCMLTHADVNTLKHRHTHTQTQTSTHSNTQSQRMSHTRDSIRLFELLRLHATHCNTLQHSATLCNSLQLSATFCTTLQHTATLGPHATYVHPLPLASLRRIDKFDFFFNLRVFIKE